MFDTIVYHGNCPDGWCAAYVLWKRSPFAKLVPATYGVPVNDNDFRDKRVCVVDFSWKRAEMLRLKALSASLIVLDHHQTAQAELEGLDFCTFDLTRSGAQLAWDFLYAPNGFPRPWYVEYVADRDLWTWELPESHAVSACIMATPQTKDAWDVLTEAALIDVMLKGRGARLHVEHYVEKVVAQAVDGTWLDGAQDVHTPGHTRTSYSVKIVNAPYPNCSDVGHALCLAGADIGLVWFFRADGRVQFSLRSQGDLDVSKFAKENGGGGHKNAAGFELPPGKAFSLLRWMGVDL